jgi:hypothetical protein
MVLRDIEVAELQDFYFSAIQLDGKPEKGERKIADDFVILINEINNDAKEITESLRLNLVALNEYAL